MGELKCSSASTQKPPVRLVATAPATALFPVLHTSWISLLYAVLLQSSLHAPILSGEHLNHGDRSSAKAVIAP